MRGVNAGCCDAYPYGIVGHAYPVFAPILWARVLWLTGLARCLRRSALGMEAARQLYGKLLAVPGAGGDLYRCAVRLEEEHAHEARQQRGAAADAACKRVTELYEAALGVHGATEWDLWLGYARWLAACGKGAGQVYWRATKALADADGFVEAYRAMMAQQ